MERGYLDVDGQPQPRNAWDIHHAFARQYARSTSDRDFINLEGLRIPLFKIWHNVGATALHANVANMRLP